MVGFEPSDPGVSCVYWLFGRQLVVLPTAPRKRVHVVRTRGERTVWGTISRCRPVITFEAEERAFFRSTWRLKWHSPFMPMYYLLLTSTEKHRDISEFEGSLTQRLL